MIFYGIRIAAWTMISIRCIINPNHKSVVALTEIGQKKWMFILGGIEHFLIFGSLLASTLILY
jgi:hypothetical protein